MYCQVLLLFVSRLMSIIEYEHAQIKAIMKQRGVFGTPSGAICMHVGVFMVFGVWSFFVCTVFGVWRFWLRASCSNVWPSGVFGPQVFAA